MSLARLVTTLICAAAFTSVDAAELSAKELFSDIEHCSLRLAGERPPFDPDADALIVRVGQTVVARGVTAHLFYFAPGKEGRGDDFGLILDGTPEAVAKALPRLVAVKRINGYRRELQPFGDPDGTSQGKGKTLLVCRAEQVS